MLKETKWTSKIQTLSRKGLFKQALICFLNMQIKGIKQNEKTFSTTLTVCTQSLHKPFGYALHGLVLKKGYPNQLFVSSGLIKMYCKFGRVFDARQLFDEMSIRDGVVWNSMISGYSQNGLGKYACGLFCEMVRGGCEEVVGGKGGFVNDFTLTSVINACAHGGLPRLGESVHGYAVKVGFDSDVFVGSSLVDMYASYEKVDDARCVFDQLRVKDVVVWNSMISGYAQNGYAEEAVELFFQMESEGFCGNCTTFSAVMDASSAMPDDKLGRSLHARALQLGFLSDVYMGTGIVDMYSKFLTMDDAERAFSEMCEQNVISYNALITGYGLSGEHENALRTYTFLRLEGMQPDVCTFIGLFTACASCSAFVEGEQVHSHSLKLGIHSDISVGNSIVNFYCKCGYIDYAIRAFETAQGSDVVSWAAIISGLVMNNEADKALETFREMQRLSEKTDEFSSSSVIKAVASLAAISLGRNLHGHVIKLGLDSKIFVGSALIDMYSKCGMVGDALRLFCEMPEKNIVTWNSMLTGYAQNGFSAEALFLIEEMERCGVSPNSVTYTGILVACCNGGLVEEGWHYYKLMESKYGISPSIEHCTCMVNLLGRSGYVVEAEEFLLSSPYKGEHGIWRSLLGSCEAHKYFDVAARVAERCLDLKPDDSSTHTILSNIYATQQLWSEVGGTRESMKSRGIMKVPGYSSVESKN